MSSKTRTTNRLQLDLIGNLADERKNVAVVGDDDQSIYGWRGAEVSNILEFESHFPNPTVVKLEQNYRSTNTILGTANHLIKNNPRRRPKQLWSSSEGGDKVRVIQMPDDRQEAQFVAEEIHRRQTMESAVQDHRRTQLLRRAGDQGLPRVCELYPEHRRRRLLVADYQHAGARYQRQYRGACDGD
jgi:superfamily I DNA/RNA helicase